MTLHLDHCDNQWCQTGVCHHHLWHNEQICDTTTRVTADKSVPFSPVTWQSDATQAVTLSSVTHWTGLCDNNQSDSRQVCDILTCDMTVRVMPHRLWDPQVWHNELVCDTTTRVTADRCVTFSPVAWQLEWCHTAVWYSHLWHNLVMPCRGKTFSPVMQQLE